MPAPRYRPRISALRRDWQVLCAEIGERLAGTKAETRAARYIRDQFAATGLSMARLEPFPCLSLRRAAAEVSVRTGRGWRRVAASPLVGAPSTPGRHPREGDLAWLEMPEDAAQLTPRSLRGKILALFGPLPVSLADHRRLLAAQPAAVIHIDERLPFDWVKNDGVYPYWATHHGMLPTLTVPYQEAWRWRREGVKRLRVRVDVEQVEATSHNVVAELPGRDPTLPALVLSAHHDTQRGNVGADDNASGVVVLLALARALAGLRPQRTIRFISFGTEEQLSVGSAAYVRAHRVTRADVGLVLNFDAVASPLGHHQLFVAGDARLERHATRQLAAYGIAVQVQREITPFMDQFPFNRAGVPSLGFFRSSASGGRWQHHSVHDNLGNVSVDVVARLLRAVTPFVATLAAQRRWPFTAGLPLAQRAVARKLGRELFGP